MPAILCRRGAAGSECPKGGPLGLARAAPGDYRFCEDDYRIRVEPLQKPVRREVRAILRAEREP